MAADTYDLVTMAEAERSLNIATADTAHETEMELIISAVSQTIVDRCGPVVNVTYTDEAHDGGEWGIALRHAPTALSATTTVAAVKEYDAAGTLTTLTAEDFDTKPADGFVFVQEDGLLLRRFGGAAGRFAAGRRNILVTYTAGRCADTASVPRKFKQAALVTINHVWANVGAQSGAARVGVDGLPFGIPPFSIPRAALDFLRGELLVGMA